MFNDTNRSLLMVGSGVAFLLAIFVAGLFLIPQYQAANPTGLQKSDADEIPADGVYLDVTPILPGMAEDMNLSRYVDRSDYENKLPFLVSLNTHVGSIEDVRINTDSSGAYLYGPDGNRYPAIEKTVAVSSHHNTYLMFFPSKDMQGKSFLEMDSGHLALRFKGLAGKQTRAFSWEFPVQSPMKLSLSLTDWIMLALAITGAMLIVLSPCAIELTVYYSGIVGATLSEYGESLEGEKGDPDRELTSRARWGLTKNLLAFTVGFTALYGFSGAMVGFIGEGVRSPLGQYSWYIGTFGGSVLVFFGLKLMGVLKLGWIDSASGWLSRTMKNSIVPESMKTDPGQPGAVTKNVNSFDSFLAGIGLSSGCLTCMGGAVLYPLMVYAGIASWYWGMLTLTLYSVLIAVPMMFIALGSADWMSSFGRRKTFARNLRYVSGGLLLLVGVMILVGYEEFITDAFFVSLSGLVQTFA